MGAAARFAEKKGLTRCARCDEEFGEGRRLAYVSIDPDIAVCQWCSLAEQAILAEIGLKRSGK